MVEWVYPSSPLSVVQTYIHTYLHRMCICKVISGCEQRKIHTSTWPLSDQNLYSIIMLYLSSASTRDRPETCGRPEQANEFASHSTILYKLFRPRTGLAKVLRSRAQILDIFSEKFLRMWKPHFTSIAFPIIPLTPRRPFIVGGPAAARLARPLVRPY